MRTVFHPLYSTWISMRNRCNNPNNPSWRRYGGRGIRVCKEWDSFDQWLADMGPKPSKNHSIDRINNDGNYEPQNCKWATQREQLRNIEKNRRVTVDGVSYLAIEFAEIAGLKTDTIVVRAERGLKMDEILSPERRVFKEGLALGGEANGARQRARTHCLNGHEFTDENTRITPEGWRRCRACHNEKMRRLNAKWRGATAVPAAPASVRE